MRRRSKSGCPRGKQGDQGNRQQQSEKEFERRVVELAALFGWLGYHAKDSRYTTCAGFPDWVFINPEKRKAIVVELKTEKGQPTAEQWLWLATLQAAGVDARLWRPSDWGEIWEYFTEGVRLRND